MPQLRRIATLERRLREGVGELFPTGARCRGVAPVLRTPHVETRHHRSLSLNRLFKGALEVPCWLRRFSTRLQSGALLSALHPSLGGSPGRSPAACCGAVFSMLNSWFGGAPVATASGWLCPCNASPLGKAPSVDAPVSRHHVRAARQGRRAMRRRVTSRMTSHMPLSLSSTVGGTNSSWNSWARWLACSCGSVTRIHWRAWPRRRALPPGAMSPSVQTDPMPRHFCGRQGRLSIFSLCQRARHGPGGDPA